MNIHVTPFFQKKSTQESRFYEESSVFLIILHPTAHARCLPFPLKFRRRKHFFLFLLKYKEFGSRPLFFNFRGNLVKGACDPARAAARGYSPVT